MLGSFKTVTRVRIRVDLHCFCSLDQNPVLDLKCDKKKSWIRIRTKPMQIHNTGLKDKKNFNHNSTLNSK